MNIFSVIILIIAGIGILNLLLMAVYERTREIGLLGALGMKPRQISLLFLLEGAMMGVVGVAFGVGAGAADQLHRSGRSASITAKFAAMTEYTALISGRIYPTLGLEKLLQRAHDRADHLRPGCLLPGARSRAARARRSAALRVRSTMIQLFKMAFRDLGRNRRRSFFSALALAIGLALLLLMAAVVDGEMRSVAGHDHPAAERAPAGARRHV